MALRISEVITVNVGSSSTDLAVVGADDVAATASVEEGGDAGAALLELVGRFPGVGAVGHRLVHGGARHTSPVLVDDEVRPALGAVAELAPLHVPPALAILDEARHRLPDLPHVACFDTAFHRHLPAAARTYALPSEWRDRWGLRRYGFHGLSYAWAVRRSSDLLARPVDDLQLVVAHLGGGSSVCAVRHGTSVDTSMGFTPLEGVVMSTRSGSVDPGLLVWLLGPGRLPADELAEGLQHRSGLLGLNGRSDTRDVVEARRDGDAAATLALEVFTRSVRREVAAAATALDRLDAVVFTGEIGADQPEVRREVCAGLGLLGVEADLAPVIDQDAVLTEAGVPVLVVVPQEHRQIAAEARAALTG